MQKPIENPSLWRLEVLRPKPLIFHGKEAIPIGERGGMALPVAVYLMMTRTQEITRAELLQVFKGLSGGSLDRDQLRRIVHDVRETFGDSAIKGRERIQWQLPLSVDADELLTLTPEAMPDDTLSLYRGDLLTGWDDANHAGRFWTWVKDSRKEFRAHALQLLEARAEVVTREGEWERVRIIGRRISALWPEREEGYLWELRALEQLGRLTEARERYADADLAVRNQGVQPSQALTDLGARLSRQHQEEMIWRAGEAPPRREHMIPGSLPLSGRPEDEPGETVAPDNPSSLDAATDGSLAHGLPTADAPAPPALPPSVQAREDTAESQEPIPAVLHADVENQRGTSSESLVGRPPHATSRPRRGLAGWIVAGVVMAALGAAVVAFPWWRRGGVAAGRRGGAAVPVCRDGTGRAALVREVYHRGRGIDAGREFTKAWYLKNDGPCRWARNFTVIRQSRALPDRPGFNVADDTVRLGSDVLPGDSVVVRIRMRAPDVHGVVADRWALLDASRGTVNIDGSPYLPVELIVRRHPVALCQPEDVFAELVARSYDERRTVAAGAEFTPGWTLINQRLCAWPADTRMQRREPGPGTLSGDSPAVPVGDVVLPGETVTIQAPMRAPARPGAYEEAWELAATDGTPRPIAGQPAVWVRIQSVSPGETAQLTAPRCGPHLARASFLGETIRDSTELPADRLFEKTWILKNTGTCRWDTSMRLRFKRITGFRLSLVDEVPVGEPVIPGEPYRFAVPMRAPPEAGLYSEYWELVGPEEEVIAIPNTNEVWVTIVVPADPAPERIRK